MGVQITNRSYQIVLEECSTYVDPNGKLYRKGDVKTVPEDISDKDAQVLLEERNGKGIPYFRKLAVEDSGGKAPKKTAAKEDKKEPEIVEGKQETSQEKVPEGGEIDTGAVKLPENMKKSEGGKGGKVVTV